MANSRSAQRPATLWPCSRTSTPLQPAASLSSLQTGCRRSNSPAVEASLWPGAESNCRHADFQSAALPTELPGRALQGKNLAGQVGRWEWPSAPLLLRAARGNVRDGIPRVVDADEQQE